MDKDSQLHVPKALRKPITARELARLLGVSQSAVSRAFTQGKSIAPALRTRILQYADELNYQPNAIASMLSKQKTNIVGIIISNMQNPFNPHLIEKLTRELQVVGLQSLMFNITREGDAQEQVAALRQYKIDSVVILSATVLSEETLRTISEGRSSILVNRPIFDDSMISVHCDNAAGARLIAEHLHAVGCKRVAYVAGLQNTSTNLIRQQEFITRAAELGMTLTARLVGGEYSYEAGYRCALEIIRTGKTDGIFFASDILALGGMDALRDTAGLRIPEDIKVAGFDDIGMAHWPRYSLTTYRQPVDEIVALTIELLKKHSAGHGRIAAQHLIPGELMVRSSTFRGST